MSARRAILVASILVVVLALPTSASASRKLSFAALDAPATLAPEASFDVVGEIRNRGNRRAKTWVRVALRTANFDVDLGHLRLRVRAGGTRGFSTKGRIPTTLAPGEYRIEACMKRRGDRGSLRCRSVPVSISSGPTPPSPPGPDFTPGARTLGDPLLPQLGNGGYDALNYEIALDYDPVGNDFDTATTTVTAVAKQDLSEFSLDFQALPVDSVTVNGVAATFTQVPATPPIAGGNTQPMKLVVVPASGIADGSQFEVEVAYHGQPGAFVDPDGSSEGWLANPTCPTPLTCSHWVVGEPIGAQAWFPANNHPSDKATFTTEITVPDGQVGLGVGEQAAGSPSTASGRTTWTWVEDDPTASYLVTASNGNYTVTEGNFTEAQTTRSLPYFDAVTTTALAPQTSAIGALNALNADMVDTLGAHWGPYPLDSYGSVWDNLPSVGYALEVQTKSHFSSLPAGPAPSAGLTSTYLHELAHQWWGNAVTLENWNDLWFNEGWAVLSEWIYAFENGGDSPEQHFDDEYAGASAGDWSVAPALLDDDPALMFSPSFPTYTRGAMTIEGYREIIGAAAFDQFAQALQAEYAYGNISTQEFIAEAKSASGLGGAQLQLLDDYFQQWLYGTTQPTITPDDF